MDAVAKVRKQFEVLETGDAVLAHAIVGPNWVDHEASFGKELGELRGPASLLATGAWMRCGIPDLHFVEKATVGDSRHVISYVLLTGTHAGPFVVHRDGRVRVIPPTGNRLEIRQTHVYRIRGEEVVDHVAVRDDRAMLARLGVLPPRPSALTRMIAWGLTGRSRKAVAQVSEAMRQAATSADPGRPVRA